MDLDAIAKTAADPDAPMRARVDALVAVVEAATLHELPIPERVAEAIDDLALVDAAHALRRASAVCAALHQLGPRAELASTRKRVVRRLIAAGATGIALAGLAIEVGDVLPAATLAVRDFEQHILPRLANPAHDAVTEAWLGWLADQPDSALAAVLRALAGTTNLGDLFARSANPARRARLATIARSILTA